MKSIFQGIAITVFAAGINDAFAFVPVISSTLAKFKRIKLSGSHQPKPVLFSTAEQSDTDTNKKSEVDTKQDWLESDLLAEIHNFQETSTADRNAVHPMMEPEMQLLDEDFVLTTKSEIENDPTLNLLSSELAVWKHLRKIPPRGNSGLPLDIILQRTWDTVEDIWQHLRRIPFEKGGDELSSESQLTRKTVVVLGSGWGSHALLKVADCQKLRIIVVSPINHFVFTPMLASAAVGTVEYRSMTEAIRAANPMIDQYIEGKAVSVDVKQRYVDVQLNSLLDGLVEGTPPKIRLEYDHLVVSVGSRVDDRGVPGAENALRLKSCDDARKLRTAVGECFEYASRPDCRGDSVENIEERTKRVTFLIVGG
jgi:hypothetical protein